MTFKQHPNERRRGFALLLALSLMAFVLLLLVSITALARVETSASSQALEQLRAEQNARTALMIALGELQKHAGPDQRVTARADILDPNIENPYWVGVWDTTQPEAAPKWLVSGENSEASLTAAETMQLVGPNAAGPNLFHYVSAPTITIGKRNGQGAQIAWWIADEGTKASIGGLPLNRQPNPNYQTTRSNDALELLTATSQGVEELFTSYNRFTSTNSEALDRVYSLSNLLGESDFSDSSKHSLLDESLFHSVGIASYGVLASVIPGPDGGLMRDLSLYPDLLGNGFADYVDLANSNRQKLDDASEGSLDQFQLSSELQGLDDIGALSDGEIATPITPILSNFMMAFTLRSHSPVSSNPNLYLRMRFFCELWNPYTNSLATTDNNAAPIDFELEITGLPTVRVIKTTGSLASSEPVPLQDLLGDPTKTDQAMVIRLNYDHTRNWLPGQSMNWIGVDADENATHSPYNSIITNNKQWDESQNTLGGDRGIDTGVPRVTGSFRHESVGTNNIRIKLYAISPTLGSRTLLAEYGDMYYEPISTRPEGYSNTHKGTTFGYHFILRGPHLSAEDIEYFRGRWLNDHDPRNPEPKFFTDWHLDNEPGLSAGSPYAPVRDGISPLLLPAPEEISETINTLNTEIFRRIMDRSWGAASLYNQLWQDTPLFELPRERPLALASLQHLYFHNERPFQVGNSWGEEGSVNTNAWFDRYYFSGFTRTDDPDDFESTAALPNPTLITYSLDHPQSSLKAWINGPATSLADAQQPAANLLVKNRFNLNSTSVAAWKAVLGSLRLSGWNYLNYPDDTFDLSTLEISQNTRPGMFTRYSQTLSETYDSTKPPAFENGEPVAPSAFYRRGARYLHTTEIERLASEIVHLLQRRKKPFFSMQEFLSSENGQDRSLLEQAIRNTLTTNGRQQWDHEWEVNERWPKQPESAIDIDHFSPGFLTQADILSAIGPMLAPRSDTFKIRARAEVLNIDNTFASTATIEAVVQRTPEPLDSQSAGTDTTNRKFKLLSFRWLGKDEI